MRFLLLSSGGQASCLKTLMKELVAREHEYFLADSNFLKNEFTTLENLHSQSFDAVIMTDYKFKKYASCKGKKKPVISTIHHGIGLKCLPKDCKFINKFFSTNTLFKTVIDVDKKYREYLTNKGQETSDYREVDI